MWAQEKHILLCGLEQQICEWYFWLTVLYAVACVPHSASARLRDFQDVGFCKRQIECRVFDAPLLDHRPLPDVNSMVNHPNMDGSLQASKTEMAVCDNIILHLSLPSWFLGQRRMHTSIWILLIEL